MIITIDGPTGTGKSTVARALSKALGFLHFDTGAMYRCLTYGIIKNNLDILDLKSLDKYLKSFTFQIKEGETEKQYFVGDDDVTAEIRREEITLKVSEISAIPTVRAHLVNIQRRFGEGVDAVFEGRDLGTVVFPNAELKIFLTASAEIRAKRRYDELVKKFPSEAATFSIEQVLTNINYRDDYDTNRSHSPLKEALDAHIVDSSHLSIDEVIDEILKIKASQK